MQVIGRAPDVLIGKKEYLSTKSLRELLDHCRIHIFVYRLQSLPMMGSKIILMISTRTGQDHPSTRGQNISDPILKKGPVRYGDMLENVDQ